MLLDGTRYNNFSHLADYEWARDWGSYGMSDGATKTNVEATRRRLTEEQEANIIRGNRIGPRFNRNLVNPKTGVKVPIVILLMRIIFYEMVLILYFTTLKIYGKIVLYHYYQ